jgi:basic amino acid/polyamine antiporter, APA family
MSSNPLFRKKTIHQALNEGDTSHSSGLSRHLGVKDLLALGIAAIIGAGIFSTIGQASADGGPGVIFLFIFTAIACSFAAFAYAEFASLVPVSGSAYTYSYVAFGELFAWIIGWALIMEYAVGNVLVAISWSDYFVTLLKIIKIPALGINGIHISEWATMDYFTAHRGFEAATEALKTGTSLASLDEATKSAYAAWVNAPQLAGLHIIFDIPALVINILITWLVYRGIKESKTAGNIMVIIKLLVVFMVIAVGAFYVDASNWSDFTPNGISGILKGVSAVFFAYIGFDALSTTAEECHNPQRDLPRSMMWSIIICTILYVIIALVLTGMVNYKELAVGDPLAFVFDKLNIGWMLGFVSISAVVAMASVLLVFQLGQPRIWMSMSRDGLLPARFSRIHSKFKTPSFATIVTGFAVGIPILFMDLKQVADICSIGTLFAFVLVCAGVLKMEATPGAPKGKFKTPYINSRYILPLILIAITSALFTNNSKAIIEFISSAPVIENGVVVKSGGDRFLENIPMWVFLLVTLYVTFLCITRKLSLIPVLGLLCCLYMMSQLALHNWIGFTIWLVVGLIIYFAYGRKNSKLARQNVTSGN